MRRLLLATLALIVSAAGASADDFIRYYPPTAATAAGVADPGGNGLMVRTASNVSTYRTITSSTLTVQNGDGVSANPSLDMDSSVYGPGFSAGAATAGATCVQHSFYYETDTNLITLCPTTDTPRTLFTLSDNLPVANLNGGTGASSSTFWRGDGSWAAAGSAVDPLTTVTLYDEFDRASNTSGTIGALGWGLSLISTGSTVANGPAGDVSHPGITSITTANTDNAGASIFLSPVTNVANADFDATFVFRAVDAVTSTYLSIGFLTGTATAATGAIRAIYDTDLAHATWIFQVCNSDTSGCQSAGDDTASKTVASANAPILNTWQAVNIKRQAVGVGGNPTISMRVGTGGSWESFKTFCSSGCDDTLATLPTGDLAPAFVIVARAASAIKHLDLDMFHMTSTAVKF